MEEGGQGPQCRPPPTGAAQVRAGLRGREAQGSPWGSVPARQVSNPTPCARRDCSSGLGHPSLRGFPAWSPGRGSPAGSSGQRRVEPGTGSGGRAGAGGAEWGCGEWGWRGDPPPLGKAGGAGGATGRRCCSTEAARLPGDRAREHKGGLFRVQRLCLWEGPAPRSALTVHPAEQPDPAAPVPPCAPPLPPPLPPCPLHPGAASGCREVRAQWEQCPPQGHRQHRSLPKDGPSPCRSGGGPLPHARSCAFLLLGAAWTPRWRPCWQRQGERAGGGGRAPPLPGPDSGGPRWT